MADGEQNNTGTDDERSHIANRQGSTAAEDDAEPELIAPPSCNATWLKNLV
jgi:hypothetical protein